MMEKMIEADAPVDAQSVFLDMVDDVGSSIVEVSSTLTKLVDDAQREMNTISDESKTIGISNIDLYDASHTKLSLDTITNEAFEEIREDVESAKGITIEHFASDI